MSCRTRNVYDADNDYVYDSPPWRTDIKHPPTQTPIRILVCVWWLSTMVIVNIYLGILFGQLVVPRRPRSIESLEELVNQREVEWCVTRGSALYELFERSAPATIYGQLGARMHNCSSADHGVSLVLERGWAFIRERSILTFKMAKEHNRLRACKLQLARENFFSVGFGLALQKGSTYLEAFNAALTLMIEDGFVARWQAQYWPQRNQYTECQLESLREGEPLSMKHFLSIYLVCSLIVCAALVILVYQWAHEHLFASLFRQICPLFSGGGGQGSARSAADGQPSPAITMTLPNNNR